MWMPMSILPWIDSGMMAQLSLKPNGKILALDYGEDPILF